MLIQQIIFEEIELSSPPEGLGGTKGPSVKNLQKALQKLGYDLEADGIYGKNTTRAVRRFQKKNQLTVDGDAGPETIDQLKKKIIASDLAAPAVGIADKKGKEVKSLQRALISLGYSVGASGADGIYGNKTAKAVRKFQKDNDLVADGDAGPRTISLIQKALDIEPSPQDDKDSEILMPDITSASGAKGILDIIAAGESSGHYDAVYPRRRKPEILDFTLRELLRDMRKRASQVNSSASGRYQYIRPTLKDLIAEMGLSLDEKFTPELQDRIALHHLKKHGLQSWLDGKISNTEFLRRLSRTWASLPDPKTGRSYYSGVGSNQAHEAPEIVLGQLSSIRRRA